MYEIHRLGSREFVTRVVFWILDLCFAVATATEIGGSALQAMANESRVSAFGVEADFSGKGPYRANGSPSDHYFSAWSKEPIKRLRSRTQKGGVFGRPVIVCLLSSRNQVPENVDHCPRYVLQYPSSSFHQSSKSVKTIEVVLGDERRT